MLTWFVGGPWNNRLVEISDHCAGRQGAVMRVPEPVDADFTPIGSRECPLDEVTRFVDYYWDNPLPSGVPVLTCLDRIQLESRPDPRFDDRSLPLLRGKFG
jgi:hypothetical protein